MTKPTNTSPPALAGGDDRDHEAEARLALDKKETEFVAYIVESIAMPLARAFRDMPPAGLVTTRYELYRRTCHAIIYGGNVVRFYRHSCDVDALLDHIWRTA